MPPVKIHSWDFSAPVGLSLRTHNFRELTRHNTCSLLYRNELIDRQIAQVVYPSAWPGDFERLDSCVLPQAKMDARIAGRHIAHATLGLFYLCHAFRSQFQRSTDSIPILFRSDQQDRQPVIGIPAVVAQQRSIIAAIVGDNVDVSVLVEVGGGQPAACNPTHEVRAQ